MKFIYCIKDVKSGFCSQFFTFDNDDVAVRMFNLMTRDPDSLLSKCPEDFELWKLGAFSQNSGIEVDSTYPRFIVSAIQHD